MDKRKKTIMSWLEGLAQDDWRQYHSDSEVQEIAKYALALLEEQEPVEPHWRCSTVYMNGTGTANMRWTGMSDIRITRLIFTFKWETGDVVRLYSPKGRSCKGRFKKIVGWWFLSMGGRILFGKSRDWKTYYNRTEEVGGDA